MVITFILKIYITIVTTFEQQKKHFTGRYLAIDSCADHVTYKVPGRLIPDMQLPTYNSVVHLCCTSLPNVSRLPGHLGSDRLGLAVNLSRGNTFSVVAIDRFNTGLLRGTASRNQKYSASLILAILKWDIYN